MIPPNVNQRNLIDKMLARYATEFGVAVQAEHGDEWDTHAFTTMFRR